MSFGFSYSPWTGNLPVVHIDYNEDVEAYMLGDKQRKWRVYHEIQSQPAYAFVLSNGVDQIQLVKTTMGSPHLMFRRPSDSVSFGVRVSEEEARELYDSIWTVPSNVKKTQRRNVAFTLHGSKIKTKGTMVTYHAKLDRNSPNSPARPTAARPASSPARPRPTAARPKPAAKKPAAKKPAAKKR